MFRFNPVGVSIELDESNRQRLQDTMEKVTSWCDEVDVRRQLQYVANILTRDPGDPLQGVIDVASRHQLPPHEQLRASALCCIRRLAPALAPLPRRPDNTKRIEHRLLPTLTRSL